MGNGRIPTISGLSLDARSAAEFRSLARERDPEMYAEGLFQLGQRLETADRLDAAVRIYTAIAAEPASLASVRRRAQSRLDAMTGVGSSALRSEFLLRRLSREAMDPAGLAGLTAASLLFRMTRVAALSRLVGAPSANFLTRGFGARAAASLLGFGVEATAFPLATRGAGLMLGREFEWGAGPIGREIAGSFLTLGAMKLMGWAAGGARFSSAPLRQAGMLGGIVLGHRLEALAGLRPRVDGATAWVDGLAMLVQVNAAGRLAHGILGPGLRSWETELELQSRSLAAVVSSQPERGPTASFALVPPPAFATALAAAPRGGTPVRRPSPFAGIPILAMAEGDESHKPHRPLQGPVFAFPPGDRQASAVEYESSQVRLVNQVRKRLAPVSTGAYDPGHAERGFRAEASFQKLAILQLLHFARKVGAEVQVFPAERLLAPFGEGDKPLPDALLREALQVPGIKTTAPWMRRVWELRIPYQEVQFGTVRPDGRYAGLRHLLDSLEDSMGRRVRLFHAGPSSMIVRFSTPAWYGRLMMANAGATATRPVYVWGSIPRDLMMAYRENRESPLGVAEQAEWVEEFAGYSHPFIITLHDLFHQGIADLHPVGLSNGAAYLYRLSQERLSRFPFTSKHLNRLADMDPGSGYDGQARSFFRFTLEVVFEQMLADAEAGRFNRENLFLYSDFLRQYRSVLKTAPPPEGRAAPFIDLFVEQIGWMQDQYTKILHELIRGGQRKP